MYPSKEKYDADHNPVLVGTCERIRNNNAPTGWRMPAAGEDVYVLAPRA